MIEDYELRQLFQSDTDALLSGLERRLQTLATDPTEPTALAEAFRLAHNVKGSARMLGVTPVEAAAQEVEDRLAAAKEGRAPLQAADAHRLLEALDNIRALVAAAVGPAPATGPRSEEPELPAGRPPGETAPAAPQPDTAPEPAPSADPPRPETTGESAGVFIEDPELRSLFRAESEEHLQTLTDGLLRLEANPTETETLSEVFRAAHSLKGSARMLGVCPVERAAHRFEDRLGAMKQGQTAPTPEDFDRLYRAVDGLRLLIEEAVTGARADITAETIIGWLTGETEPVAAESPAGEQPAAPPPPSPEQAPPPQPSPRESPSAAAAETTGMLEDPELRSLFRAESEEHLQVLDSGLLVLETNPTDGETLEEVFRAAHSLKGSARMLGVSPVETLAHRFEEALAAARQEQTTLTPERLETLYQALVALRQFVEQAVTGTPASLCLEDVLVQLEGQPVSTDLRTASPPLQPQRVVSPPPSPTSEPPDSEQAPPPTPSAQETRPAASQRLPAVSSGAKPSPAPETAAEPESSRYHLETIRVDPAKLDALMTQSGELVVTKLRVAHRLTDVEALFEVLDEWHRDLADRRQPSGRGEGSGTADTGSRQVLERDRERLERLSKLVAELDKGVKEDAARLELVANRLEEGIRTVRMLPLATIFNLFRRTVRDLAKQQGKEIRLVIEGGETTADKLILEDLKDPLMHMVRNAADHGIELPEQRERAGKPRQATIWLRARQTPTNIIIEVQDDGRGLDVKKIKRTALKRGIVSEAELAAMSELQIYSLITRSGFSTSDLVTDVSGRGVGMDVVYANVEQLKGSLHIESSPGQGATFQIRLPLTLATTQVLLLSVDGRTYALPVENIDTTLLLTRDRLFTLEGRDTVDLNGESVSVARLGDLLELPPSGGTEGNGAEALPERFPCVVLSLAGERLALIVDELIDEQEVVLKPHSRILRRVRNVAGSTILETGQVCIVLNPHDLVKSVRRTAAPRAVAGQPAPEPRRLRVLLAEDSLTTRVQMTRILEGAGYDVVATTNGREAYDKLLETDFDAVVSDIQMPDLDGFELTERIRQESRYADLPVILVTSLVSDEDRRRGADAGADAYITKPAFDQTAFLDTLKRLI